MKQSILEKICVYLLSKGYTVKSLTRTCFDVLARKEDRILLIKILEDANSISEAFTKEMKRLSAYINASPVIIAEKAGDKLQNNVVYSRFDIYTLNLSTFKNCVENKMPFVRRDHAGLTATIRGDKLKERIEGGEISLGSLSKRLGVSKKMIQKYESGAKITINKAFKLYDLMGHSVFDKVEVFSAKQEMEHDSKSDVAKKYTSLGFEAAETKKTPFNVIAKKGEELILTDVGDKPNPQIKPLSKLIDADSLVIFKKKKPKNTPSMTKKEFLNFEKAKELIKFLKEY
jgi:putative transcriptional regulator|tara:strand:+ start:196 stop:1056 length:861 start_codon:yes stop_codon:yes gene_type:complete